MVAYVDLVYALGHGDNLFKEYSPYIVYVYVFHTVHLFVASDSATNSSLLKESITLFCKQLSQLSGTPIRNKQY